MKLNPILFLKKRSREIVENRIYNRRNSAYDQELSFTKATAYYQDRNALHTYMHHYFHFRSPQFIRDHRMYFKREQRGFGEDAFHAMWLLLLLEYKPFYMLEIGVYRGQVISLWSAICKYLHQPCETNGVSPFSSLGDSVSIYLKNLDYMADVRQSFDYWQLAQPVLIQSLVVDEK